MSNGPRTVDRIITVAAAVSSPVLLTLVDLHAISTQLGVDLGAIVAAAVGAYHGGAVTQRRRTTKADQADQGPA